MPCAEFHSLSGTFIMESVVLRSRVLLRSGTLLQEKVIFIDKWVTLHPHKEAINQSFEKKYGQTPVFKHVSESQGFS